MGFATIAVPPLPFPQSPFPKGRGRAVNARGALPRERWGVVCLGVAFLLAAALLPSAAVAAVLGYGLTVAAGMALHDTLR